MSETPSLHDCAVEARRELRLREYHYPRWLREWRKGYTKEICDHRIACMERIAAEMEKLKLLEEASTDLFKRQTQQVPVSDQP